MDFFRGIFDGGECFITAHQQLAGARSVSDPFALLGLAEMRSIVFEFAQSSDTTWFGVDVKDKMPAEKVAWIEDAIKQAKLYFHIRLPRQGEPQNAFRLNFGGRIVYVTNSDWIPNTRQVSDVGWLQQNAHDIAVTIASSRDVRYFGFDFIEFTHDEKVEWLVDNIVHSGTFKSEETGVEQPLGLRVFADDPSDQLGRSSSSSSSSSSSTGGNKPTQK